MRTLSLTLLLACGDKPDTATPDTGTDTDTTPVDTADTGGSGGPQLGSISGDVILPEGAASTGGLTLGLVHIDFGDADLTDTLATTAVSAGGSYTIDLDAPPDDALIQELEPYNAPGMMGAAFLPLVFIDDGDGRFLYGEQVAGGTLSQVLFWLEGDVPEPFVYGWNLIDTGLSGTYETGNCIYTTSNPLYWRREYNRSYPAALDLGAAVDVTLYGLEAELDLAGTTAGLEDDERLSLLSYQTLFSGSKKETWPPLRDLTLSEGTFSASFSGPPGENFDISADPSWGYALGFGVVYTDADGDKAYSDGEASASASLCVNNSLAALRYTWPVTTYRGWRLMECYTVQAGWRVVTRETNGQWAASRTNAESLKVVVDEAECSL